MLTTKDVVRHKFELHRLLIGYDMPKMLRRFIHTFSDPAQEQKLITQFDCRGGDK